MKPIAPSLLVLSGEKRKMANRVLIWGASGHAKVVLEILHLSRQHEIAGLIDDVHPERRGEVFSNSPVLGGAEELENALKNGVTMIIIAFGNNAARMAAASLAETKGFQLVRAIHPSSIIAADVSIGYGTVVAAGAVINPATTIGKNVIVNTLAGIDHDCVVQDGAHVGPGSRIAGGVTIGRGSWIGIGATVIDGRQIGQNSIVGAGAVVVKDIPDGVVAVGVPAKVIRKIV
jgi:acetyltransferase EpsM